jgi:GTP-binding protein
MQVVIVDVEGNQRKGKILQVKSHLGLERIDVPEATAGEIICITGIDKLHISDTICDPEHIEAMPPLTVDQPTISMTFQVNDSPFAGREGKYVTTRNLKDRLERELIHNVALRVEPGESADKYKVSGRGELHLSVLIESMRREGFELAVSRPEVIMKEVDGIMQEPYEALVIDCNDEHQGAVIEELGLRRAEMQDMLPDGKGRVRLTFEIPTRGLIGFRSMFMSMTSGTGMMNHVFDHYGAVKQGELAARKNGVLVSMVTGKALGYSLWMLQERGRLFMKA